MNRAPFALAATFVTLFAGAALAGQATQAPPMTSVLAGKKFTPPVRGQADVEFTAPVSRREKNFVITRIQVKDISNAPIARLTITETWYDKGGAVVTGSKGFINGLLQPGEIQTITIETPYDAKMSSNNFTFTHANGTVKPTRVAKLDAPPKDPAAKPAATAKK
jgi:hypothetical protein